MEQIYYNETISVDLTCCDTNLGNYNTKRNVSDDVLLKLSRGPTTLNMDSQNIISM